jgi:hypothetical protein
MLCAKVDDTSSVVYGEVAQIYRAKLHFRLNYFKFAVSGKAVKRVYLPEIKTIKGWVLQMN